MDTKPALAGLKLKELAALLPYPDWRAKQIHQWICSGAQSFNEMRNLPALMRKELEEKYRLYACTKKSELQDPDGTVKMALDLSDGAVIEAVILNDGAGRKTACLSSQAGCAMGCVFCKTGKLGFKRNLSAAEIAAQFLQLRLLEKEISHIVVMGMGEPLLNLGELRSAIDFFTEADGLNISKRRITISSCGIAGGIDELASAGPDLRLALSLNTGRQELREELMPASSENPLPLLKKALLNYQKKRKRRITLEMVLLGGINTGAKDALAAADFACGLKVLVNLIPWNPVDGLCFQGQPLRPPGQKEIAAFAAALESHSLNVTRRAGKGRAIGGACGQLGLV
ncbi:MAG: 23S rRNA (adenine(2503)-C(2))-methyltransferase RlmN [Treponema sp.]|nr:23S rRNA (adenine(2503)-C(2))-methyltransferase RlmN [Treponema sp.]